MEKFATFNCPISTFQGLTRTASFSELPTANRRIILQESDSTGGLVKQYSYEQIFIKDSNNIKKIQYSTLVTAEKQLSGIDIWKKNIPRYNSASNMAWPPRTTFQDKLTGKLKFGNNLTKKEVYKNTGFSDLTLSGLKISDSDYINDKKYIPSKLEDKKSLLMSKLSFDDVKPSIKAEKTSLLHSQAFESQTNLNKSNINHQKLNSSEIKKNIWPLMHVEGDSISNGSGKRWIKILLVVLIALGAVIIASLSNDMHIKSFDFTNASFELQQKVYGQDTAIKQLSDHFDDNTDEFSVVVFVGATGVGKSYTKKIIKKHFPYSQNIFEYTPPLKKYIQSAYDALSKLQCNLIVLENLKSDDLPDFLQFTKFFYTQKERPCVIILAIVNPQIIDDDFVRSIDLDKSISDVNSLFSGENILVKIIGFKSLPLDVIDICIKEEAKRSNIELSNQQFEEVRSLMTANSGCKGAYAKVQLYAKL